MDITATHDRLAIARTAQIARVPNAPHTIVNAGGGLAPSCSDCGGESSDLYRPCGEGPLCTDPACLHYARVMVDGGDGWTCPTILGVVCHLGHDMQATIEDDACIRWDGSVDHNPGNVTRVYCEDDCRDIPDDISNAAMTLCVNDARELNPSAC